MARARRYNYRRNLIARLPHAVKVQIPLYGLGDRLNLMHAWAARRCGLDGYTIVRRVDRGNPLFPQYVSEFRFGDEAAARAFEEVFSIE